MEEWRPVKDFANYEINKDGIIRNSQTMYILKPSLSKNGNYPQVCLHKDGKHYSRTVHRLMGLTFLENPNNYETIDHIDRNRQNNNLSNLRWANRSEQAINRNKRDMVYRETNTGHHHISYSKSRNRYIVQKRDIGVLCKTFKTLQEAIAFRDTLLI